MAAAEVLRPELTHRPGPPLCLLPRLASVLVAAMLFPAGQPVLAQSPGFPRAGNLTSYREVRQVESAHPDPSTVTAAEQELAGLVEKEKALLVDFGAEHPDVLAIRAQMNRVRQVLEQLKTRERKATAVRLSAAPVERSPRIRQDDDTTDNRGGEPEPRNQIEKPKELLVLGVSVAKTPSVRTDSNVVPAVSTSDEKSAGAAANETQTTAPMTPTATTPSASSPAASAAPAAASDTQPEPSAVSASEPSHTWVEPQTRIVEWLVGGTLGSVLTNLLVQVGMMVVILRRMSALATASHTVAASACKPALPQEPGRDTLSSLHAVARSMFGLADGGAIAAREEVRQRREAAVLRDVLEQNLRLREQIETLPAAA